MARIHLVHWHAGEAQERAERLRAAGWEVTTDLPDGREHLRPLRDDPPAAFVIDLSRLPSQGRDVALALRGYKATRGVPLVFVEGDPGKVDGLRALLPDARYTTWRRIRSALREALADPVARPVVPPRLAGYSGTPLLKKLGIKAGAAVLLAGAPDGFESTLGEIPDGAVLRRGSKGRCDLAIWFVTSRRDLEKGVKRLGALAGEHGLWIAWPKKASGVETDLSEKVVRETGLASGLVDYKICAIDETWSGLKFTRRKS